MGTQRLANESTVEAKNTMLLLRSPVTNQEPSIEPLTPDKLSSPIVLVSDFNIDNGYLSPTEDGSVTPKDCVFDPFAPGDDKFMLAPLRRKYSEESRSSAVRHLSFPLAMNLVNDISEKSGAVTNTDECDLFESLYHNILEAIILELSKDRVDGVLTGVLDLDSDADGFRTPKSAHLSWIAETCPGAPMKLSSKGRNIDKELCRKLEY